MTLSLPSLPAVVARARARARVSCGRRRYLALALLAAALPSRGVAQAPVTVADGRLTLTGQASVSIGSDDDAYFNYSSYEYSLLRLLRVDGAADLRVNRWVSVLGDLQVLASLDEGHWRVRPYALFARVRPWSGRAVDIQAGLIPPVFGVFSRRGYETDNPLIGYPLAYQYLTSLRGDALPATLSDLLDMRGHGWLTRYPVGEATAEAGLPLVEGLRYQSGIELRAGDLQPIEAAVAWTSGALSTPDAAGAKGGKQISARLAVQPASGLVLGVSGSRGTFLSSPLREESGVPDVGDQVAIGIDAEYSRGHYVVRSEAVFSGWRIPLADPPTRLSLGAFAINVEGRYRVTPRLYAAARVDRLQFGDVAAPEGPTPWEFPVTRVQLGAGYLLSRHALLKVEWQRNVRDATVGASGEYGARPASTSSRAVNLVAAQLVAWF